MLTILVGIPIGIGGSFVAWWIVYHRVIPKIEFSQFICKDKLETDNSGFRYRIKLENNGSRSVLDLELITKYRVKGLRLNRPSNWEIADIPITNRRILKFGPVRKNILEKL